MEEILVIEANPSEFFLCFFLPFNPAGRLAGTRDIFLQIFLVRRAFTSEKWS